MYFKKIDFSKRVFSQTYWYGINYFYKFLPLFLVKKIKNKYAIKLFSIQKGFNKLLNNNGDDFYYKILEDVKNINFNIKKSKFSKNIFGNNINNQELIIKQFLINNFFHPARKEISISRSILKSFSQNKSLIFPLHKLYFKLFESRNIKLNKFLCLFYWNIYIFIYFLYGILNILKINFFLFTKINRNYNKGVYFISPPKESLNIKQNNNSKNDLNYFFFIIDYYTKISKKLKFILHPYIGISSFDINKVVYKFSEKFNLNLSFKNKFRFILWSFKVSILCLFDLFRGRWWHPLLLSQSIERKLVELLNSEDLHELYLFNNTTGFVYKPMWTYEAEKKGIMCILYFYSLNYNPLTKKKIEPEGLSISNWNYLSVWGKEHEDQLKNQINNNFKVFSYYPVYLNTGYMDFSLNINKFISIFDVTPIRPIYRKSNFFSSQFTITKNVIKFIDDIIQISKKNNINVILKIKRVHSNIDKYYLNYLNNQIEKKNIIVLNEEISTISLIKKSKLVISYPLTSISKLAASLSVKNIYYSPIDLKIDESLLLNSEIIYGQNELDMNLKKIL